MSSLEERLGFYGQNAGYVRELYELYQTDRSLVGESWASIFDSWNGVSAGLETNGHTIEKANGSSSHHAVSEPTSSSKTDLALQEKVWRLIRAYRERGHLRAKTNPLHVGVKPFPTTREIQIEQYGFSSADLEEEVLCDQFGGSRTLVLSDLIDGLERSYCGSLGFEYLHLLSSEAREFFRERIESRSNKTEGITPEARKRAYSKLVDAEVMEKELHRRYVGHKWFSLQGGETAIPMLDALLNACPQNGVQEMFIGMAHRGRLNTLVNTLGKPLSDVFNEFDDQSLATFAGAGDTKYHMGYDGTHVTPDGRSVRVSMAPNPSHLEFVNPVLEGIARARQDLGHSRNRAAVLPFLIHGDAAVIGQGVVYETLNLSAVHSYATGGSIHLVINNQVGFTTNPEETRSSIYCTDGAKAFEIPVIHVNSEDPDAACWAMDLALKYRNKFQRDIVIDLLCYRKYGHNEGDDPNFTQPVMYSEISAKESLVTIYGKRLVEVGLLTEEQRAEAIEGAIKRFKAAETDRKPTVHGEACAVHGKISGSSPKTACEVSKVKAVAHCTNKYPEGFSPNPKLAKILDKRVEVFDSGKGIDWGFAELLAFGTLVLDGVNVRLSGQDCGRGTFSQRHVLLNHYEKLERFSPLEALATESKRASFDVMNSTLSEAAVLGFEFGYSSVAPRSLILWEGQFGDFANGAQVIIDQFLAASEAKWGRRSGITLLLPHGYEGAGPEHSSARLERFLQLCAEGNMTVCYPSKAAQHFHLLRRQGLTDIQRPLVVMTPKSLLRNPAATCTVDELVNGEFKPVVVDELGSGKASEVLVMMSGKVFYDCQPALEKCGSKVSVARVEQLYPFPLNQVKEAIKSSKAKRIIWVQEEPRNMGAFTFIEPFLREMGLGPVQYIGRPASASPATGSSKWHAKEQKAIIDELLARV